jgi:sugar phosphate isomerase/epimerase
MDELGTADVQFVLDTSHVVAGGGDCVETARAFGERLAHVHLRDAVPGDIHRSIGSGEVDFAALLRHLTATGYEGHYSLELETNDVAEYDRPAEAARAGAAISDLLTDARTPAARSSPPAR